MFAGIDEVDWASMEHAYGPAGDVPAMLRGLASADAAEREAALDGMYGAVHHQGDVYACTLASIPFLFELVVDPGIQDRGSIVELLTSIGGIDLDEDDEEEFDADEIEGAANYAMAATAVTAGAGVFFELMTDEDPGVRLCAPLALAALHDHPDRVLALLRERLPVEPDEEVRLALVEAAGRVALRHRLLAGEAAAWLTRLAGEGFPPGLRLAALAQLARCAPDALPGDVVRVVTGLLRQLRPAPA
ncbi:HEAT repeat domain-containing protein, partial [Streptomyces sp. NPDC088135]